MEHKIDVLEPGVENVIEFLVKLYHTGIGYSATNTARSAFPTILTLHNDTKFGEHPLVARYMKGILNVDQLYPNILIYGMLTLF